MTTYYVSGATGSDSNAGTSFGAAFATIGKLNSTMASNDIGIICASATYTLTSSITWTSAASNLLIIGANATGTIDGTQPTITSSTSGLDLFYLNNCSWLTFRFLKFTHTGSSRGAAFSCITSSSVGIKLDGVSIDGCSNALLGNSRDAISLSFTDCYIANCTGTGIANAGGLINDTTIYNCGGNAVDSNGSAATWIIRRSILANCTSCGFYGSGTNRTTTLYIYDCTLVENGHGIASEQSTGSGGQFNLYGENNVIWGNGGYGVYIINQTSSVSDLVSVFGRNFYGSNTSSNFFGISSGINDVIGITNPFTNKGSGKDWSCIAGSAIRATGYPSAFRGTNTIGYPDAGSVQHQDIGNTRYILCLTN